MGDALRTAVKRSLGALVAALAGSRRAEVAPLVAVELYLDTTHRIELRPSAQVLQEALSECCHEYTNNYIKQSLSQAEGLVPGGEHAVLI